MSLGVCPRASPDNQRPNKHVESTLVSCLDPGSIPGSSTSEFPIIPKSFFYDNPDNIDNFFVPKFNVV